MSEFIGSLVSLDCGEVLGTYQGQIVNVDSGKGKITIVNAYQNGIACAVPRVTLNACDIYDLRIVKNASEAQSVTPINKHIRPVTTTTTTSSVQSDINVSATNEITNALRSIGINIAASTASHSGEGSVPAPIYDGLIMPNANNNCIPINRSPERSKLSPSRNILLSNGKKSRNGVVNRSATVCYTNNAIEQSCGQLYRAQGKDSARFQGINQGEARPRSVNGKKSPPVGNVTMGNSLSEGSRSKSAGDFIGMTSAEFLNACVSQLRKDESTTMNNGSKAARNRTTSASEQLNVPGQSRKSVTPRKDRRQMAALPEQQRQQQQRSQRQQKKNQTREDCFTASVDNYINDEFDFESNLALFNKQAVYDEIEKDITSEQPIVTRNGEAKYRCDENVLPTVQAVYRQIKFKPIASDATPLDDLKDLLDVNRVKEYITDLGLIVPAINSEIKQLVLDCAESFGFKREKRLEILGRSSAEMSMQLLGGATRFNPKNGHQMPVVVVICSGGSTETALALCCARHLATRSISVIVLMPDEQSGAINGLAHELNGAGSNEASEHGVRRAAEVERKLFLLTGGQVTSKLSDIPSTHVDLIITCVGSSWGHDAAIPSQKSNSWYKSVHHWANNSKAQVLAVDPPSDGAGFISKWCLTDVLPLAYDDLACGQVNLCDISLPARLFDDVGVTYVSPFAHKYIIPLYTV